MRAVLCSQDAYFMDVFSVFGKQQYPELMFFLFTEKEKAKRPWRTVVLTSQIGLYTSSLAYIPPQAWTLQKTQYVSETKYSWLFAPVFLPLFRSKFPYHKCRQCVEWRELDFISVAFGYVKYWVYFFCYILLCPFCKHGILLSLFSMLKLSILFPFRIPLNGDNDLSSD